MKQQLVTVVLVLAGAFGVVTTAQEATKRTPEKEAQVARAWEILEEARKAAFTVPPEQTRERALLLQGLSMAYAEAGDADGALRALAALGAAHPQMKASLLAMVAVQQARSGDVNAALDTLSSVEDGGPRSMALMHVVSQLAQQGYTGPARQFIDQIEDEEFKDQALARLAYSQLSAGDVAGARLTASEIVDEQIQGRVTKSIATLEAQPPENRRLQSSAGQFPAVTLGSPGVRPETASFRVWLPTAGLLVAADESENPAVTQVRETVRAAVKEKEEGDKAATVRRLQEAAQLADALEDEEERADHLWFVAAALAEVGQPEEALATSRVLSKEGHEGEQPKITYLLCIRHIAMTQAAAGKVEEALAWAEAEPDTTHRAVALLGTAEGILRRVEMDYWPPQMHESLRNERR